MVRTSLVVGCVLVTIVTCLLNDLGFSVVLSRIIGGGSVQSSNDNGTNTAGVLHACNGGTTMNAVVNSVLGITLNVVVTFTVLSIPVGCVFSGPTSTTRVRHIVLCGRFTKLFYILKRVFPLCFGFGNKGNITTYANVIVVIS